MSAPNPVDAVLARWLLGPEGGPGRDGDRWQRSPVVLGLLVVLVYLPSLSGGWLGYDDDWLVRDNEVLSRASPSVLVTVLAALDRESRLMLGAEYLPVRDVIVWLTRGLLGLDVIGHRIVLLGLYVAATLVLQEWARRVTATASSPALLYATWLFAVHPVHVESVAWLAGYKDVLALLFTGLALLAYARDDRPGRALAILWVALACFSKGVAVITPLLLVASDLLRGRRPDGWALGPALAVCALAAAVHTWVGGVVGMLATPVADTPLDRVTTMLVVLGRYVGLSAGVLSNSVFYEVPVHRIDASSVAVALGIGSAGVASGLALRRGVRWPAFALSWFLLALAPVAQLAAPLQNRMADRYLLVAVLGFTIAFAEVAELGLRRLPDRAASALRVAPLLALGGLAALHASAFADPVVLFTEATERTERDPEPAYMLAEALVESGDDATAEQAYLVAIQRDGWRTDDGRAAGNNLARLFARTGRADQALELYRVLVEHYPDDPRVLHNLAVVEAGLGEAGAAERHRAELADRFPDYVPGRVARPGPLGR